MRALSGARWKLSVIREAAEHGISAAALHEVERAIAEQERAGSDPHLFADADDRFHRAFADAIGYGDIWSVVESQKAQFDRIRFLSLPDVTPVDSLSASTAPFSMPWRRRTRTRPRRPCVRICQSWSRRRRR